MLYKVIPKMCIRDRSRALLCDSPILILDEATSSVDTKTEKDIQRALIRLKMCIRDRMYAHLTRCAYAQYITTK